MPGNTSRLAMDGVVCVSPPAELCGLLLRLLPCEFQQRACRAMQLFGLLSVWPTRVHFLLVNSYLKGACLVVSHRLTLLVVTGQ